MGFPPWSRGPLLHRGEKRKLSPLVEHGDSNPLFDITWLIASLFDLIWARSIHNGLQDDYLRETQ